MKRVRIEHDGSPAWGQLRDGEIALDSGAVVDPASVTWLAPVEPSKILAVHLTYRSRLVDYDARQPPEPSYFMKPPTTLNGHLGEIRRPRGARYLNYEGELAVIVGALGGPGGGTIGIVRGGVVTRPSRFWRHGIQRHVRKSNAGSHDRDRRRGFLGGDRGDNGGNRGRARGRRRRAAEVD